MKTLEIMELFVRGENLQAISTGIAMLHTFFNTFYTDERYNRTEWLFPSNAHVSRHLINQNRPYEITFSLILLKEKKFIEPRINYDSYHDKRNHYTTRENESTK